MQIASHATPKSMITHAVEAKVASVNSAFLLKMFLGIYILGAILGLIHEHMVCVWLSQLGLSFSLILFLIYVYQITGGTLTGLRIILFSITVIPMLIGLIWVDKSLLLASKHGFWTTQTNIYTNGVKVSWGIFGMYCLGLIFRVKNHHMNLEHNLSWYDDYKLEWLYTSLKVLMGISLFHVILFIPDYLMNEEFIFIYKIISIVISIFLLFFWFYFSDKQKSTEYLVKSGKWVEYSELHQGIYIPRNANLNHWFNDEFSSKDLYICVVSELKEKKCFTNRTFSISDLSNCMNVPGCLIAQVILESYGMSFYRFINHHRTSLLREKLVDPDLMDQPLFELCLDCGFSSQKQAEEMFQEFYHLPPGVYRSRHLDTKNPVSS